MKELFCEDPTYLYVTFVIVELLLLFIFFKTRNRKVAIALLVPVLLGIGTWALDHFVTTDREQITNISKEIGNAAAKGDLQPSILYLDEGYAGYIGNKKQLINFGEGQIKKLHLTSCKLTEFDIKVTGKRADMTVVSTLKSDAGIYCLKWKVYWVKTPKGWRIRDAEEPKQTVPGFGL